MKFEQLAFEMLGLPNKARAVLAEKLLSSLEEEGMSDIESAWVEEAEKRFKEIQDGSVNCTPAGEVMEKARARLK